jgi:hypothetical protein
MVSAWDEVGLLLVCVVIVVGFFVGPSFGLPGGVMGTGTGPPGGMKGTISKLACVM